MQAIELCMGAIIKLLGPLERNMPVFISYSHKDGEFANKLGAHLVKQRANVWIDTWELNAGDSILDKIQEAIVESSALIILLSKDSVSSAWCKKELNAGLMRELDEGKVLVLPVLLDDCDVPVFLREKKYVDFRKDFDIGLHELLDSIASVTNSEQGRLDEDDGYLDWAEDWYYEGDVFCLRFTYIGNSESLKMSFLTHINIRCNSVSTARHKQFESADIGWIGRQVIAEAMFDLGTQKDFRIILDDQFPKKLGGEIRDSKRNSSYTFEIETRKLGRVNGKDQLIDISDYLIRTRDFMRAVSRDATLEEKKKLLEITAAPWPSDNVAAPDKPLMHKNGIKDGHATKPYSWTFNDDDVTCPVCLTGINR